MDAFGGKLDDIVDDLGLPQPLLPMWGMRPLIQDVDN